jgi:hypothetical protein
MVIGKNIERARSTEMPTDELTDLIFRRNQIHTPGAAGAENLINIKSQNGAKKWRSALRFGLSCSRLIV